MKGDKKMDKYFYMLQWNDGNGGSYTRTFYTYEERANFIPRIAKRDCRGQLNYTVWENKRSN